MSGIVAQFTAEWGAGRIERDISRLNDALLQRAAEGSKKEKRGLSVEDWVVMLHL
jgi:hypothetical protein